MVHRRSCALSRNYVVQPGWAMLYRFLFAEMGTSILDLYGAEELVTYFLTVMTTDSVQAIEKLDEELCL